MVKLWIKVIKDDKIVKDTVVEKFEKFEYSAFADYLSEACYTLDLATPVVIKNHIFNYAKYNVVRFLPSDFLEPVDFDYVWVENLDR
ncbi:MAG: hypothetical protein E7360_02020 [Clostridiales bacterium]|nr:hypothetical protein [Clostridiales bacterium]